MKCRRKVLLLEWWNEIKGRKKMIEDSPLTGTLPPLSLDRCPLENITVFHCGRHYEFLGRLCVIIVILAFFCSVQLLWCYLYGLASQYISQQNFNPKSQYLIPDLKEFVNQAKLIELLYAFSSSAFCLLLVRTTTMLMTNFPSSALNSPSPLPPPGPDIYPPKLDKRHVTRFDDSARNSHFAAVSRHWLKTYRSQYAVANLKSPLDSQIAFIQRQLTNVRSWRE